MGSSRSRPCAISRIFTMGKVTVLLYSIGCFLPLVVGAPPENGAQQLIGESCTGSTCNILKLRDVKETVEAEEDLSLFNEILERSGGTFYLVQSRDITLLAPTNKAVLASGLDYKKLSWQNVFRIVRQNVLTNFILKLDDSEDGMGGPIRTEKPGLTVQTWEETPAIIRYDIGADGVKRLLLNESVEIFPKAFQHANGVLYKVDTLVLPPNFEFREDTEEGNAMGEEGINGEFSEPQQSQPEFLERTNESNARWNISPNERVTPREDTPVETPSSTPDSVGLLGRGAAPILHSSEKEDTTESSGFLSAKPTVAEAVPSSERGVLSSPEVSEGGDSSDLPDLQELLKEIARPSDETVADTSSANNNAMQSSSHGEGGMVRPTYPSTQMEPLSRVVNKHRGPLAFLVTQIGNTRPTHSSVS